MISLLAFIIAVSKLAIAFLILYYVVPLLTAMPVNIQRVVQALIILCAICAVLEMVLSDAPAGLARRSWDPLLGSAPSIVAPERR